MSTNGGLRVSETFLSIQGEGQTAGRRAVFLRLQGCDFACSFCDTIPVHSVGQFYTHGELRNLFHVKGYSATLRNGAARLVVTGGNPLLQRHSLAEFLQQLAVSFGFIRTSLLGVEVETQASIIPSQELADCVDQWNVSPKLANSGIDKGKRIVTPAMEWYASRLNSTFKFVVRDERDIQEIVSDFILPFQLDFRKVWLMPMASTRTEHATVSQKVAEIAIQMGVNFSPRLQLVIWDKAIGV